MPLFSLEVSFKELEPSLIDEELIRKNLSEQGTLGESNGLPEKNSAQLEEIKTLRLEFLNILAIDHLWMMTSLVKLDLSNNMIEKIENLESLVKLKELNLSFNSIERIENLESLVELEILTLYENAISKIENLDFLSKLRILSIGNNKINNWDDFLQSLNMAGNPCCSDNSNGERKKYKGQKFDEKYVNFGDEINSEDLKNRETEFRIFTVAHLPNLRFFNYCLVKKEERGEGQNKFRHKLLLIEENEEKERLSAKKIEKEIEFCSKGKAAWVDNLYGSEFIDDIFEIDHFGKTMSSLDENLRYIYKEFCYQFMKVTSNLYEMALIKKVERDEEEKQFIQCLQRAKDESIIERRSIMADLIQERDQYSKRLISLVGSLENSETFKKEINLNDGYIQRSITHQGEANEKGAEEIEAVSQIQKLNFEFRDLCQRTLEILMTKEMHLYDQVEEVLSNYKRNITDHVNNFIEISQGLFVSCRELQRNFSEQLATIVPKIFNVTKAQIAVSNITTGEERALYIGHADNCSPIDQKILEECLESMDALQNAIASSHDIHVQMMDSREDKLITEANYWLMENLSEHSRNEIRDYRERLYEIITVINHLKEEFEELQTSLMTVPILEDIEMINE